mmetsp:Transcript_61101/g.189789  ORF Transcript_61101/g.189789 Transcript_61101/m.189789 type:complete len:118 (+) Transcript_61101:589-942(+)
MRSLGSAAATAGISIASDGAMARADVPWQWQPRPPLAMDRGAQGRVPLWVCGRLCMCVATFACTRARARSHRERTGAHAHVQLYRHEFVKPSCPFIVVPAFAEVADGAMKLGFLEHF